MKKVFYLLAVLFVITACNTEVTREADALFNEGEYTAAIEAYNEYLATKPKDIKSLYNRGRAFEELGQVERAKKDFTRILDIDGENLNANLSMGKYWYQKERFPQAINFFDKVIMIDGRVSDAYMLKARSYHQMGEFEEAMESYNLAINFDNKNDEAYLYRGALKVALNQMNGACKDLNRAKGLGSKEASVAWNKHCR